VVERATSRPTCDALSKAMRAWGVPDQVLTDNAKVFTGRFGPSAGGEVLFDRICRENGIFERRHQGIGDVVPWERFRLAIEDRPAESKQTPTQAATTRKVSAVGKISFASQPYPVGVWLTGETVEVSVDAGLVTINHRGPIVDQRLSQGCLMLRHKAAAR